MAVVQAPGRPARLPRRWTSVHWPLLRWSALAGALGGLVGWALGEPLNAGTTASAHVYADVFLYFLVVSAAIGATLGALPGALNRSRRQAVRGALIGGLVGGLGGGLGGLPAQFAFHSLGEGLLARAVGWGIVGAAIGVCPAAATRDRRRVLRGLVGGLLGGFLGGLLFNLAALAVPPSPTDTGTSSRLIADLVVGLCVGLAVAAVEAALKKAWLTVSSGRREGAQFILSKDTTLIGRDDRDDVILWGDPQLACSHARIDRRNGRYTLESRPRAAPPLLNGQPVPGSAMLRDGDEVVLGTTRLRFQTRGATPRQLSATAASSTAPRPVASGPPPSRAMAAAAGPTGSAPAAAREALPGERLAEVPGRCLVEVSDGRGTAPRAYSLPRRAVVTVGRGPGNEVVLDDETVSTRHAELRWEDGRWVVYDLSSTNGTFLSYSGAARDERRVVRNALKTGSTVRFGSITLRLEPGEMRA